MSRVTALLVAAVLFGACASGGSGGIDASGGDDIDSGGGGDDCDGLPCEAIYVDGAGGADSNPGTLNAPLATIAAGIDKAGATSPPLAVFIREGTYAESLTMTAGVSLYGGFSEFW